MNGFVECTMLREQYRMVPILYGGALTDAVHEQRLPTNVLYASGSESIVFINVDAKEETKRRSSLWNSSEVEVVLKVVESLLQSGDVKAEEIAVSSPYLPQIEEVEKQTGTAKTEVGACVTIDGAQGNGYSIVISVSCVAMGQTKLDS